MYLSDGRRPRALLALASRCADPGRVEALVAPGRWIEGRCGRPALTLSVRAADSVA
jgi:hypothetical protein